MTERSAALKFSTLRHLSHASKVYSFAVSMDSLGTLSCTLGIEIANAKPMGKSDLAL